MPSIPSDRLRTDIQPPPEAFPNAPRSNQLNRIRAVREQQGVSLRTASRRLGLEMAEVRRQQEETADLTLSQLGRWCEVLDVPVADLLVDPSEPLSRPIRERAQMIRLMKTAAAMLEQAENVAVQRMARTLVDQLIGMMPELQEVGPWHSVGQRRSMEEYGRTAENSMPDNFFNGR
ncbi:helix-turn-helix domain-containing protein [Lignipirellula cremea]|uniref:Uncharacterized protein n=1 Tax=Lignipirellula cremea TaxID=2528010 RepID=A0A518DNR5_9BACT|nr:helix-turn-helix transcriptional regulator [Lignipirellula cremea]QDU93479.1 hypothetical protein Pla8534_12590 [Lignipirellula cremea]